MEIREAYETDLISIKKVAENSWRDTYMNILSKESIEKFLSMAYNLNMLRKRLNTSIFYVALVDGEVCGFINFSKLKESMSEIVALYVDAKYKYQGIGKGLCDMHTYLDPNLKFLELSVEMDNTPAINFYMKQGFKEYDRFQEDFMSETLNTIRMCKNIIKD